MTDHLIYESLVGKFQAAGIPAATGFRNQAGVISVQGWTSPPTAAQLTTANSLLASVSGKTASRRTAQEIITGSDGLAGLTALTPAQKAALWTDFTTNKPWLTNKGENAVVLTLMGTMAQDGIIAAHANARAHALALFIQDSPQYAVNPAFSPAVNVPGENTI